VLQSSTPSCAAAKFDILLEGASWFDPFKDRFKLIGMRFSAARDDGRFGWRACRLLSRTR